MLGRLHASLLRSFSEIERVRHQAGIRHSLVGLAFNDQRRESRCSMSMDEVLPGGSGPLPLRFSGFLCEH